MSELIWFNISVLYSAIAAWVLATAAPGSARGCAAFFVIHGALWAIYRGMKLAAKEIREKQPTTTAQVANPDMG